MKKKYDHSLIKVIGICGFKGSGKDTVASYIWQHFLEYWHKLVEDGNIDWYVNFENNAMARPIRELIKSGFAVHSPDYESKEGKDTTIEYLTNHKLSSYRDLMITVGENFKKIFGQDIWCKVKIEDIRRFERCIERSYIKGTLNFVPPRGYYIIPDIRFKNELKMLDCLKKAGYDVETWCVLKKAALPDWVKAGLNTANRTDLEIIKKDFQPHPSEFEWCEANPQFDTVIYNDGTLGELKTVIQNKVEQDVENFLNKYRK